MVATWPSAAAVASGPSGGPGQRPTASASAPRARRKRAAAGAVVERREEERRAAVFVGVVEVDVRCCFQQVFHLFGVSGFTGIPELVFIRCRGGQAGSQPRRSAWVPNACAGVVRCSAVGFESCGSILCLACTLWPTSKQSAC